MIPTQQAIEYSYSTGRFNLVIEKLMIPTSSSIPACTFRSELFQSRNREAYDSNLMYEFARCEYI